jgi:4'-phosphopantetheinyl transferase
MDRGSDEPAAHAYYCQTHLLRAHHTDAGQQLLSPDERRRCGWLSRERDRRDYVAAHALLRAALSVHTRITPDRLSFDTDAAGRPSLGCRDGTGAETSFSLSHTAGLVACVIASHREAPGIDVEAVNRSLDVETVARHVCSTRERLGLRDCSAATRHTRFFELWTLKEAVLKAQGIGLSGVSTLPSFHVDGDNVRTAVPPGAGHTFWSFRLAVIGATHVLAVALASSPGRMSIRTVAVDAAAAMTGALVPIERPPID